MLRKSIMTGFPEDRISNLPDEVIDHILNCLPLRDAVRTSILSRGWRYKWVTIPHLVFDGDFERSLPGNCDLESTIDQILILHKGPIVKFFLKGTYYVKSHSVIDRWLHFLSNHRIEDLALLYHHSKTLCVLPSHVFSFDHLKHLYLAICELRPSAAFKGFSRLVRLDLLGVNVAPGEFKRLISKCPMLEFLSMCNCYSNDNTHLSLDIDAPNLKSFQFTGKFISVCFGTANLEEILISYAEISVLEGEVIENMELPESNGSQSNLIKVLGQMPSIKRLEFSYLFLQFLAIGGVPQKLPNDLSHLTLLQLSYIDFGNMDNVTCALCLIRSSPNLQNLEITFETVKGLHLWPSIQDLKPATRYLKAQQKCEVPLSRLRNVKIYMLSGVEPEMEFLKLLLLVAPVLRKMEIKSAIFTREEYHMFEELASFPLASSKAVITFNHWC